MNPRLRRTRQRTADDIEVRRRTPIDPRLICIRCYAILANPKAIHCPNCQPKKEA